jgi:hypothetical protein
MTAKPIKEWTEKAPAWDQIVEHYRANPGLIIWLSNRLPALRGEIEDVPAPTAEILKQEVA